MVDKGRATDVISLDLCKVFDTVPREVLVSVLERHRFNRWTTWRIRKWVAGSTQRVVVNGSVSKWKLVTSGIPQWLVLRLELFNTFVSNMGSGMEWSLRKVAEDTKLRGSVNMLEEGMPSTGTLTGLRGGPMQTS